MGNIEFEKRACELVSDYVWAHLDETDKQTQVIAFEIFVVWMSKVLQNNKAMISTTLKDGMYYEVTYNGDKNEFYLDAYKKFDNKRIAAKPEK